MPVIPILDDDNPLEEVDWKKLEELQKIPTLDIIYRDKEANKTEKVYSGFRVKGVRDG